jgi:hypothetical protein
MFGRSGWLLVYIYFYFFLTNTCDSSYTTQKNVIYAEIPGSLVVDKTSQIQVNKTYDIRRFKILSARSLYKPIDGNLMIQFTIYTEVRVVRDPPNTFLSFVYKLSDFKQIEDRTGQTENFIGNYTAYLFLHVHIKRCDSVLHLHKPTNCSINADDLGVITYVQPLRQASQRNTSVIRDITINDIE